MIDTHCHLLPGLDDGPESESAALALASSLAASGVTFVLCTPHYSSRFPTNHLDVLGREASLTRALENAGIELELAAAAELSPERAIAADDEQLLARSISRRFLLVELLPDTAAISLETISNRLAALDLVPIFAHPERCRAMHGGLSPLDAARRKGALVQVVASSLLGRWGGDIERVAWRILDTGRADLLASDSHHHRHGNALLRASTLVADRLGESVRNELTQQRPTLVVPGGRAEAADRR